MKIIKKLRAEAGLTIHQLAEQSNVAAGLISELERGEANNLKFETVEKLSNFFHADRDEIHKAGERMPRDLFFKIVNSDKSFNEIREILNANNI